MDIGPWEILIVFAIILLLFGGAKLPKLARSLGEAKAEFEKGGTSDAKKSEAKADAKDGDDV